MSRPAELSAAAGRFRARSAGGAGRSRDAAVRALRPAAPADRLAVPAAHLSGLLGDLGAGHDAEDRGRTSTSTAGWRRC